MASKMVEITKIIQFQQVINNLSAVNESNKKSMIQLSSCFFIFSFILFACFLINISKKPFSLSCMLTFLCNYFKFNYFKFNLVECIGGKLIFTLVSKEPKRKQAFFLGILF